MEIKTIKAKLEDIKPNPYKKGINGGKLNQDQIAKLVEGYKQTTFHENLLARKNKKGQIELVYGHHRLEAAKKVYGKNHVISINLVDYNDEQMIIDMCRENLTQRFNEFRQELDAVLLSKKWLEAKKKSTVHHVDSTKGGYHTHKDQEIGSRQIAEFLSKDGKAISKSKVAELLSIAENLDKNILNKVKKFKGSEEKDGVTYEQATELSKFEDKKEQRDLLKAIKTSQEEYGGRPQRSIAKYKEAPEEIKRKVREGKLDLTDVEAEVENKRITEKMDKAKGMDDNKARIIHAREIVETIRDDVLTAQRNIDKVIFELDMAVKKGFGWYDDKSRVEISKIARTVLKQSNIWKDKLEKLEEKISVEVGI